ncbi:unnamed protein product [Rangifer tarandus platyrhynchus]|uniref:Uncharacterized protein n=2 Tax=Rangifer tarandus platyrhynchus TaxID=3082113 RepID=A0ACB0DPQ0_RANTA|nr:unnamed protein product [Rangifer tarandus platyrhynchus]CAI9690246.1 unnamed protein product [Rangifer tarandus platyrhynchus]
MLEQGVRGEVRRESPRDQRLAERGASQGWESRCGVLTEQHGRRSRQKHALKGPVGSEKWTQARGIPEVEEAGLGDNVRLGAEGTGIWGRPGPDSPSGTGSGALVDEGGQGRRAGRQRESGRVGLRHTSLPALALLIANLRGHMGAAILAH